MSVDRDTVRAALDASAVAQHLGIPGAWRGRWLRSRRCATQDHASDAFGLSRDGMWHCHACDEGGDLLKLLALGLGLDVRRDFPAVLAVAAQIAGIADAPDELDGDFGAPEPNLPPKPARPPIPPPVPNAQRIALARKRAAWTWARLTDSPRLANMYLETRGLNLEALRQLEMFRCSPLRIEPGIRRSEEMDRIERLFASLAVCLPVRAITDGALVDIRARRCEPREGQPKIVGMLGGVTTLPAENMRARQLVGCYGHPHHLGADVCVVVEGWADYLTAVQLWPNWDVLGAVEAGQLSLVVKHAAEQLAARDDHARLLIVEQKDPPRTTRQGVEVAGAADRSVNEEPNSAAKVALRKLGPQRVGWLFCDLPIDSWVETDVKDLNDLSCVVYDVGAFIRWRESGGVEGAA